MLVDQSVREEALNTKESFIVTAPAGSGKTYLLTRRILNLLLTVEHPSHIVAITFTKKAALEMKERVFQCLSENSEPITKAVLERSHQKSWNILENIDDLSIMTLDAFSSWLLSKGKPINIPKISQSPFSIYQTIVYQYYSNPSYSKAQKDLLTAFHGEYTQLENLLCALLASRDQWQSSLNHEDLLKSCQQGINDIIHNHIDQLNLKLKPIAPSIQNLFSYHSKIASSMNESLLFKANTPLETLSNLATLCLTSTGTLRKSLNKRQGIYPKSKAPQNTLDLQSQFMDEYHYIQDYLSEHELLEDLFDTNRLPSLHTSEEHQFLSALSDVMNQLLKNLHQYFQTNNLCDFIQIALESKDSLACDPILQSFVIDNIFHLLVDEFQDTSQSQYQLLENLISHWPKPNRTLFAVGDPMQSIYRFRQADVSLFIKLQSNPIAHLKLKPLSLVSNFRSSSKLIDVVNDLFTDIFPKEPSEFYCKVPYSKAKTTKPGKDEDTIYLHLENSEDNKALSNLTLNILKDLQSKHPNDSIAILVQARSHLKHIIPLLEHHKIPFNAIDIYPTLSLSSISDLNTLLSSLIDPYDRLSLMSVLRSPLCGLSLEELASLENIPNPDIFKLNIENPYFLKFKSVYLTTIREPNPVYRTYQIWHSLFGEKLYPKTQSIAIESWFEEVSKRYEERLPLDLASLIEHFKGSYNSIITPNAKVNLLTAHKSKGLEYDHVIIPHIEKRKPQASTPLFYCENSKHPIIQPTFSQNQKNIDYFKYINKKRDQYENLRLLYVATTRAKYSLHFISHNTENSNTWLSILHPLLSKHPRTIVSHSTTTIDTLNKQATYLSRSLEYTLPNIQVIATSSNLSSDIGTALHFFMQCLNTPNHHQKWLYYLHQNNLDTTLLLNLSNKILSHQNDPTFQWIVKPYPFSKNEYSLAYNNEHYILDRVFLDQDTLWIVDYKFPTSFIDSQKLLEKYASQLDNYQQALSHLMDYPIKKALYLPLENRLIEYTALTIS